ncbi:MAG: DUF922 domain-containing Zn-dependent protease, partial [Planctomycetales bacterium]
MNSRVFSSFILLFVITGGVVGEDDKTIPAFKQETVPRVVRSDIYMVAGESLSAVEASMIKRRPFDQFAYAQWHIDWNYSVLIKPEEYRLTEFDVLVQARLMLPQWDIPDSALKQTKEEWKRFMDAVILHENGHVDIGLQAANEMRKVIASRDWVAADKKALNKAVNAACQDILEKYQKKEIEYDDLTDHRRTQGASLNTE